jgi:hypothetical protein
MGQKQAGNERLHELVSTYTCTLSLRFCFTICQAKHATHHQLLYSNWHCVLYVVISDAKAEDFIKLIDQSQRSFAEEIHETLVEEKRRFLQQIVGTGRYRVVTKEQAYNKVYCELNKTAATFRTQKAVF